MYTGKIDENGDDLYPEIQVLEGETLLLLFYMDSRKYIAHLLPINFDHHGYLQNC